MITRNTLQNALYIGLGTLFLAMIGMFTTFSEVFIVRFSDVDFITADGLALSDIILFGVFLGAGFFAARRLRDSSLPKAVLNGLVAALIAAAVLAVLVFIASPEGLQGLLNGLGLADITIDLRRITENESFLINLSPELVGRLTFSQESLWVGMMLLLGAGALTGVIGALLAFIPGRALSIALYTLLVILVLGLLQDQLSGIISIPDAVVIAAGVGIGYLLAVLRGAGLSRRIIESTVLVAVLGLIVGLVFAGGQAESGALPDLLQDSPAAILISFVEGRDAFTILLITTVFGAALGAVGAAMSATTATIHNTGLMIIGALLMLGIITGTRFLGVGSSLVITLIMITAQLLMRDTAARANKVFLRLKPREQRASTIMTSIAGLVFVLLIPQLLNSNITNILDLVGLFLMMGLGLNIVVGFAGLLDLGYVAFFAIGAYTTGVLTTPNPISCIGVETVDYAVAAAAGDCPLLMTFWLAWPMAVLISGLAGVMLGIPVLRLRGDYLAIVTLGFGEIINRVVISDTFKDYLGGAQGITNIASPEINLTRFSDFLSSTSIPILQQLGDALAQPISLTGPGEIYYLILFGLLITTLVSYRLSRSRLGRSWRAMREDEDVAQAMGINLVQNKLLAFAIGAAFSGIGGAIFGSYLKSIFPNSFTLLVSINVLSLIIIGGLGSIPGVFVGALMIYGLPEALREFREFRLLLFGALLVVTMLLRPQGIVPPTTPEMEERAEKALSKEGDSPPGSSPPGSSPPGGQPQPEGAA